MKYTIHESPSFSICGIQERIKTEKAFEIVPKLWGQCRKNGILAQLVDGLEGNNPIDIPTGILGIVSDSHEEIMSYYIATINQFNADSFSNYSTYTFPSCTWIKFEGNKKKDIPLIYSYFKNEWLPSSDYDMVDIPIIESYSLNHKYMHIWSPCYIWFGITKEE